MHNKYRFTIYVSKRRIINNFFLAKTFLREREREREREIWSGGLFVFLKLLCALIEVFLLLFFKNIPITNYNPFRVTRNNKI